MRMIDSFEPKHFNVVDTAMVDDELWYQIRAYSTSCKSKIRSYNPTQWYEHSQYYQIKGTLFDIHGKLFTMIALEFPNHK